MLLLLLWVMRRRRTKKIKRIRRYKTRPVFQNRTTRGEMILMTEIYSRDAQMFHKCFRMNIDQFDYLLFRLKPLISSKVITRDNISARQDLL